MTIGKSVSINNSSSFSGCFNECSLLKELVLPNTLDEIDIINTFKNCSSLKKLIIPENVTKIISNGLFDISKGWDDSQTIIIVGNKYRRLKVLGLAWASTSIANVVFVETMEEAEAYAPKEENTEDTTNPSIVSGEYALPASGKRD